MCYTYLMLGCIQPRAECCSCSLPQTSLYLVSHFKHPETWETAHSFISICSHGLKMTETRRQRCPRPWCCVQCQSLKRVLRPNNITIKTDKEDDFILENISGQYGHTTMYRQPTSTLNTKVCSGCRNTTVPKKISEGLRKMVWEIFTWRTVTIETLEMAAGCHGQGRRAEGQRLVRQAHLGHRGRGGGGGSHRGRGRGVGCVNQVQFTHWISRVNQAVSWDEKMIVKPDKHIHLQKVESK